MDYLEPDLRKIGISRGFKRINADQKSKTDIPVCPVSKEIFRAGNGQKGKSVPLLQTCLICVFPRKSAADSVFSVLLEQSMTNEKWKICGSDKAWADTSSKHDNAPQGLLLGLVGHEPESSGFDYRRKRRVRTEIL